MLRWVDCKHIIVPRSGEVKQKFFITRTLYEQQEMRTVRVTFRSWNTVRQDEFSERRGSHVGISVCECNKFDDYYHHITLIMN